MIISNIKILRLEIERNSTISFHFRVEIEITPDTTQYTFVEYKSLYLSRCSDKILNLLNYRFDFSTARLYHDHIVYKSTILMSIVNTFNSSYQDHQNQSSRTSMHVHHHKCKKLSKL